MKERKAFLEAKVEFAREMFPMIVGPECQERHLEYRSGDPMHGKGDHDVLGFLGLSHFRMQDPCPGDTFGLGQAGTVGYHRHREHIGRCWTLHEDRTPKTTGHRHLEDDTW